MAVAALPKSRIRLRQAIVASGMPAWQIGHLADVSPTVLSHIATGRRAVRADEAERLAEVLGEHVGELFPDDAFEEGQEAA